MKPKYTKTIAYYDSLAENYTQWSAAVVLEDKIQEFITQIISNGHIIDVACWPWHDSRRFLKDGLTCVWVDGSEKMISIAKNLSTTLQWVNFQVTNVLDIHFPALTFDGAWCSSIFVHLTKKDAKKLLQNLKKILKKWGILGIITASEQDRIPDDDDVRHYTMYELDEMNDLLSSVGFKINKTNKFVYGRERIFSLSHS